MPLGLLEHYIETLLTPALGAGSATAPARLQRQGVPAGKLAGEYLLVRAGSLVLAIARADLTGAPCRVGGMPPGRAVHPARGWLGLESDGREPWYLPCRTIGILVDEPLAWVRLQGDAIRAADGRLQQRGIRGMAPAWGAILIDPEQTPSAH